MSPANVEKANAAAKKAGTKTVEKTASWNYSWVASNNAINTSLFLIRVDTASGNGTTFAEGTLTAIELVSLVGIAAAEGSHADNFVFVA